MKILALRGRNLASLAGDFEVNFEHAPLNMSGLFCISGPTGSGKTTLLDAMCLALYNNAPRLQGAHKYQVGLGISEDEERLGVGDPRSFLRRGAVDAFAEVDFETDDGTRYSSRWSVERAERRQDGPLKKVRMSLCRATDKKPVTTTLSEIENKVGLNFQQFCRSVLLAQGDFAAFLKASEAERAELLERMTGTQVYGALSIAAQKRAKAETEALGLLKHELSVMTSLDPQQRQALEARIKTLEAEERLCREKLKSLEQAQEWYARLKSFRELETKDAEADAQARASHAAAEDDRKLLAGIDSVQHLRTQLSAFDGAETELRQAELDLEAKIKKQQDASAILQKAESSVAAATRIAKAAALELEKAEPEIEKAKLLDQKIEAAKKRVDELRQQAIDANLEVQRSENAASEIQEQLEVTEKKLAACGRWLERNRNVAPLISRPEHWKADLRAFSELSARLDKRRQELSMNRDKLDDARAAMKAATKAKLATNKNLDDAVAAVNAAKKRMKGNPAAEIRAKLEQARKRSAIFQQLLNVLELIVSNQKHEREARAQAEDHQSSAKNLRENATKAARGLETETRVLEEAERNLEQLQRALSMEDHRAELKPGENCPLCGATEHPWAKKGAPGAKLLKQQRARVEELRTQIANLNATIARAEADSESAAKSANACLERAEEFKKEAESSRKAWLQTRKAFEDDSISRKPDEDAVGEIKKALSAAEQNVNELALRDSEASRAEADLNQALQNESKVRGELAEATEKTSHAEREVMLAEKQLENAETEIQKLGESCGEKIERLSAIMSGIPDWRAQLDRNCGEFLSSCESLVQTFETNARESECSKAQISELRPKIEVARNTVAHRRNEAEIRDKEFLKLSKEYDALVVQRRKIFEGRTVAEIEAALKNAEDDARKKLEFAQADHTEATGASVSATAARIEAEQKRAERLKQYENSDASLKHVLVGQGIELAALRQSLSLEPDKVAALRQKLKNIDAECERAAAAFKKSRELRENHESKNSPLVAESEVPEASQLASEKINSNSHEMLSCRTQLKQDDEMREKSADLQNRIAAQEAKVRLWGSLHDLIGHHEGSTFRVFAQGLALETLLAIANERLKDFAPRYALMRVPGTDMNLQIVDRDMGDEVRSINSLSGGETFLVSLALALALAGVSSRQTRVDSLFIDEGFGTLDPKTLDVALAALDTLQASGRRIGLISHVAGIAERVGAEVRVIPRGGGRSEVKVCG